MCAITFSGSGPEIGRTIVLEADGLAGGTIARGVGVERHGSCPGYTRIARACDEDVGIRSDRSAEIIQPHCALVYRPPAPGIIISGEELPMNHESV